MSSSIKWIGFGVGGMDALVHFYPSTGPIGAPYEVTCKISVGGEGVNFQSLTLEGARLSHPDGVLIRDLFPLLASLPGERHYLIEVELTSDNARHKLDESACVIELKSKNKSVKYRPKNSLSLNISRTAQHLAPELQEDDCVSHIMVANSGQTGISLNSGAVLAPKSISRLNSKKDSVQAISKWSTIELQELEDVSYFLVYARKTSQAPLSVCSL